MGAYAVVELSPHVREQSQFDGNVKLIVEIDGCHIVDILITNVDNSTGWFEWHHQTFSFTWQTEPMEPNAAK